MNLYLQNGLTFHGRENLSEETFLHGRVPFWPADACCEQALCRRKGLHSDGCACSGDSYSVLCGENRVTEIIKSYKTLFIQILLEFKMNTKILVPGVWIEYFQIWLWVVNVCIM